MALIGNWGYYGEVIRISRELYWLSYVKRPFYRHSDGGMAPAVVLPIEMEEAVGRAVLERARARVVVGSF